MGNIFDVKNYIKFASKLTRIGIWEWDPLTDEAVGDKVLCDMFGVHWKTPKPINEWLGLIHPEDRDLVVEELKNSVADKSRGSYKFRIYNDSKKDMRLIHTATTIIENKLDFSIKVIGVNLDVTDLLIAEEVLKTNISKMESTISSSIDAISLMGELRDPYTAGHETRVADLCNVMATQMGIEGTDKTVLLLAARVHDIGKFWIPSEILSRPGPLLPIQYELVKLHSKIGYEILKEVNYPFNISTIVVQHHERIDGTGYPFGLIGSQITLEAKIIAVADVVEAIASHRPYRPALGIGIALKEIEQNKDIKYDSEAVNACLHVFRAKGYELPEVQLNTNILLV